MTFDFDRDRKGWLATPRRAGARPSAGTLRGAARIVCNFAHEPQRVPLRTEMALDLRAAWEPAGPPGSTITMPARSVAVLA